MELGNQKDKMFSKNDSLQLLWWPFIGHFPEASCVFYRWEAVLGFSVPGKDDTHCTFCHAHLSVSTTVSGYGF